MLRLLFIGVFLVVNLIASDNNINRSFSDILKTKVLKVGIYKEDIYPFFMHDESGKFTGYDVDMALDIGEKLGVKIEFNREATTFNQLVDMVEEKKLILLFQN